MNPLLLALVPAYALADSFAGGSLGAKAKALDDRLPGRGAFWGALLCAAIGFLAAGASGALLGLVWLIYRTPGWRIFGGSAAPLNAKEYAGTLARHLIPLPFVLLVAYWGQAPMYGRQTIFLAGYALAATGLAAWYGQEVKKAMAAGEAIGKQNTVVELARGAAFGAAIVGGFGWNG